MNDAAVGHREGAAKARRRELRNHLGELRRHIFPAQRVGAVGRESADRIETETDIDRSRRDAAASHQSCEIGPDAPRRRADIQVKRNAGRQVDAVEHAREHRCRWFEPKTVGTDGVGKNQNESGGAVFKIGQRLRIGRGRIGMIDTLQDGPGPARSAAGDNMRRRVARIERFDGQAVMGLGLELRERRAFEHGVDQLAPVGFGCGCKIGQRKRFGRRHGCKMPFPARVTNMAANMNICARAMPGQGYGRRSMPAVSSRARASRTRVPPMMRSGAISASGTSTKARSNIRGCGSVSSGASSAISS